MPLARELTVADVLEYVAPGLWDGPVLLRWPPDAFAAAALLLHRSGAYVGVLDHWPPMRPGKTAGPSKTARSWDDWARGVRDDGDLWGGAAGIHWISSSDGRAGANPSPGLFGNWELPGKSARPDWYLRLRALWTAVTDKKGEELFKAARNRRWVHSVLEVCALADEACRGVGQPPVTGRRAMLMAQVANRWLVSQRLRKKCVTLCRAIPASRVIVLPKLHTPQTGMTLRGLTHHLAFCLGTEVHAGWYIADLFGESFEHSLNILVVPWPERVHPAEFRSCATSESDFSLSPAFGHFAYAPANQQFDTPKLRGLIRAALERAGDVDGVVLPELAVASVAEFDRLVKAAFGELTGKARAEYRARKRVVQHQAGGGRLFASSPFFVIAGVRGQPARPGGRPPNLAMCAVGYWIDGSWYYECFEQTKQHSWKLNASQIRNYNLGKQLDASRQWWEHNALQRDVQFVALADCITLCVVICEDLARPDPLTEMVRAVGPTLVLALLMDAPQLAQRWPGRYASVLADDPGSSVLTATSIGMVRLSTPPPDRPPSRSIGLWKEAEGEASRIELPPDADAVLLTLSRELTKEWSIDGRWDDGTEEAAGGRRKGILRLTGVLPIAQKPDQPGQDKKTAKRARQKR